MRCVCWSCILGSRSSVTQILKQAKHSNTCMFYYEYHYWVGSQRDASSHNTPKRLHEYQRAGEPVKRCFQWQNDKFNKPSPWQSLAVAGRNAGWGLDHVEITESFLLLCICYDMIHPQGWGECSLRMQVKTNSGLAIQKRKGHNQINPLSSNIRNISSSSWNTRAVKSIWTCQHRGYSSALTGIITDPRMSKSKLIAPGDGILTFGFTFVPLVISRRRKC